MKLDDGDIIHSHATQLRTAVHVIYDIMMTTRDSCTNNNRQCSRYVHFSKKGGHTWLCMYVAVHVTCDVMMTTRDSCTNNNCQCGRYVHFSKKE